MTKTRKLNRLFVQWKKEVPLFQTEHFYTDGIIDEKSFEQNPVGKKILFIAKEPNAGSWDEASSRSFLDEWNREPPPTYSFAQRISEWAYGIIHDFPPYESLENKLSYLKRIAFMNVKKSSGGAFTDNKEMYRIVKPQCAFILKQVDIIQPDIIVAGISFAEHLIEDIFGKVDFIPSGYNVRIGRYKNAKVINFYHPSGRNVPVAMYCLLQQVVQSKAFREL